MFCIRVQWWLRLRYFVHAHPGGGGGVGWEGWLALEMGRGDPVAIRLMAKKTPCPNFEIYTEFNWLVYGAITTNIYTSCFMVLLSFLVFVYDILWLSALRLDKNDVIRLIMAWEISKIHANRVSWKLKKHHVPILEAQKRHPVPMLEVKKRHPVQRHIPSNQKYMTWATSGPNFVLVERFEQFYD